MVDGYRLVAVLTPAPPLSRRVTVTLSHRGKAVGGGVVDNVFNGFGDLGSGIGAACLSSLGDGRMTGLVEETNFIGHGMQLVEDVFPRPGGTYAMRTFKWSDGDAPSLAYRRGELVFKGFDTRMAYLWSAYAFSAFPLQLQAVRDGRLADVTSQYPSLVRHDASYYWSNARSKQALQAEQQDGSYAGWAADECRLERATLVWNSLNDLARKHALSSDIPARVFVAQLERTLVRDGYCRAPAAH